MKSDIQRLAEKMEAAAREARQSAEAFALAEMVGPASYWQATARQRAMEAAAARQLAEAWR